MQCRMAASPLQYPPPSGSRAGSRRGGRGCPPPPTSNQRQAKCEQKWIRPQLLMAGNKGIGWVLTHWKVTHTDVSQQHKALQVFPAHTSHCPEPIFAEDNAMGCSSHRLLPVPSPLDPRTNCCWWSWELLIVSVLPSLEGAGGQTQPRSRHQAGAGRSPQGLPEDQS